jgi:hypothetical protein
MMALVLKSWMSLLYFDIVLRFRGLQRIHDIVRNQQVCSFHEASIESSAAEMKTPTTDLPPRERLVVSVRIQQVDWRILTKRKPFSMGLVCSLFP